jgi:hypothetical protein
VSLQLPLIHEDFMSALTTCVQVLGGAKKVGVMLRPEYEEDPDKAARWLLACLNAHRDEKLSWEQTFSIMRKAKAVGCHVAMAYITQDVGYADPQPIEPQDELAKLQRDYIQAVKEQQRISAGLERLIGMRGASA